MTPEHTATGGTYDLNVTRIISDYPDFLIRGGFEGFGYSARRRANGTGRPGGRELTGMSLDELAAKMDDARTTPGQDPRNPQSSPAPLTQPS
jgi:hypothetical protein